MVQALGHDQLVLLQALVDNIPGFIATTVGTANTETLSLADGVVHQAAVFTDDSAVDGHDLPRLCRNKTLQKIPELALTDKTDAGAVFFGGYLEALLPGNIAHCGLVEFSNRKQGVANLVLVEGVQKIRLILVLIETAQELEVPATPADARIVAGGNTLCTEHLRVIEERLELDFTVAHDVGIRRAPDTILVQEIFENVIPVLAGEINRMQWYAEPIANLLRIGKIDTGRTILLGIVFLPVLHEQPFDLVTLLQQQVG